MDESSRSDRTEQVAAQDWKEWSEAGLARLLWRYARLNHQELAPVARLDEWPTAQQEAIASEWCRTLLYRLLVPVLSGVILRGRLMALPLPSLCLHLSSALTTEGVELPEAPLDLQERWPDVGNKMATALGLQAFLEQTLQPLFQRMSGVANCRERLLWCSAACYWQWWLQTPELESAMAALPAEALTQARERLLVARLFIEQSVLPCQRCEGGECPRNPMHQPLRWRHKEGEQVPVRKVCCQRHQIPGLALCSYCPHLFAPPRTRRDDQSEQE